MFNSKRSIDGHNCYWAQLERLALSKTPETVKNKVIILRVEAAWPA